MKIYVDTQGKQFTASRDPEPKTDGNGRQRNEKDTGRRCGRTQVFVLDETGGEVIAIAVAGVMPTVTVGQVVKPVGLEAIPWNNNGKHGVAFRAVELKPVSVSAK